jgi:hypothetical protein
MKKTLALATITAALTIPAMAQQAKPGKPAAPPAIQGKVAVVQPSFTNEFLVTVLDNGKCAYESGYSMEVTITNARLQYAQLAGMTVRIPHTGSQNNGCYDMAGLQFVVPVAAQSAPPTELKGKIAVVQPSYSTDFVAAVMQDGKCFYNNGGYDAVAVTNARLQYALEKGIDVRVPLTQTRQYGCYEMNGLQFIFPAAPAQPKK